MATKPTGDYELIESWATSGTKTKPDSTQIANGWTTAQKPLSSIFNWNWDFAFKWFKYLVDKTDEHDNLSYLRTIQTQTAHGFNNDLVYCDSSGLWQKAIGSSLTTIATHFAVRIDDNNFYCYSNGEISSTGILDSGGSALVEGSTYILSKTVSGKASTTVLTDGSIIQPCFRMNDGKIKFLFNSNTYAENQKIDKSGGTFTGNIIIPDATLTGHAVNKGQLDNFINNFQGYINGLIMSNNTFDSNNDIDISAGIAMDSTNSIGMKLSSTITKKIDAFFVEGTNQGANVLTSKTGTISISGTSVTGVGTSFLTELQVGDIIVTNDISSNGVVASITSDTVLTLATSATTASGKSFSRYSCSKVPLVWLHVFLISKLNNTTDIIFDTRLNPDLPSGYIYKRRIGSVKTDASGNILGFYQNGDEFIWKSRPNERAFAAAPDTLSHLLTISTPLGITTEALLLGIVNWSYTNYLNIQNVNDIDIPASATDFIVGGTSVLVSYETSVLTNISSQIRYRISDTGSTFSIISKGYVDKRGKQ